MTATSTCAGESSKALHGRILRHNVRHDNTASCIRHIEGTWPHQAVNMRIGGFQRDPRQCGRASPSAIETNPFENLP
jgi:hypothetical protein